MSDFAAYLALFLAAFVAATLFPAQSEAVLVGMLASDRYSVVALVVVASVGNTLGSVVNYWLGRWVETFSDRKWFPVRAAALEKAKDWYRHYGRWSLLLAWAPFIGDPITVAAGVLRERFSIFLVLVAISKTCRYIALTILTLGWFGTA
ncbi:YqaA family protein [Pseudahrensia aquimaris]|uniref:YqaA family protein n=1 Tax=Pseudahrensia aquimaris TaxID=744461 RepID=A0ABW3FE76_9HYPH